jgi:hypothetical protein
MSVNPVSGCAKTGGGLVSSEVRVHAGQVKLDPAHLNGVADIDVHFQSLFQTEYGAIKIGTRLSGLLVKSLKKKSIENN